MTLPHDAIKKAALLLKAGKLVAIPTETVYGLAADAKNPEAIAKIFAAKGRPKTNPLIIHLSEAAAITDWAIHIPEIAWTLAKKFWPGPLTLVLERHPEVPLIVTGGQDTVALRVPNHPMTLALLKEFGGGLAAPSANRYKRISPTTPLHVQEELGDKVDFILDGGPCQVGIESTIVYIAEGSPIILRQGAITKEMIQDVLKIPVKRKEEESIKKNDNIIVPGSAEVHYSPEKPLYLLEKEELMTFAEKSFEKKELFSILSFFDLSKKLNIDNCFWIKASEDPILYAQELYANLRQLDKSPGEFILVEKPPETPEWLAIIDRLQRARTSIPE